jgi:hypothetical protein
VATEFRPGFCGALAIAGPNIVVMPHGLAGLPRLALLANKSGGGA